jgi:hypothetical protein
MFLSLPVQRHHGPADGPRPLFPPASFVRTCGVS